MKIILPEKPRRKAVKAKVKVLKKKKEPETDDQDKRKKYRDDMPEKLIAYFKERYDNPHSKVVKAEIKGGSKNNPFEKTEYETVGNPLPTFEIWAVEQGITPTTFWDWVDKESERFKEELSDAYKIAKAYQHSVLMNNGLIGAYKTAMAIFTAKNIMAWRDSTDLTSGGQPIKQVTPYTDEQIRRAVENAAKKYTVAKGT